MTSDSSSLNLLMGVNFLGQDESFRHTPGIQRLTGAHSVPDRSCGDAARVPAVCRTSDMAGVVVLQYDSGGRER